MKLRLLALALPSVVALQGCGSDPTPIQVDAGSDASLDAKPTDSGGADAGKDSSTPPDASGSDASDAATPCNGSVVGQCGSGFYCKATACGLGTCAPAPAETSVRNPICGCDGVTYWNESVAQNHGVSTQTTGECKAGKTCGGIANLKCPTGANCNFKVASAGACGIADASGDCWGLPAQCPQIVIGPQTRACGKNVCAEECSLIKGGSVWYDDKSCPQ